MKRPAVALTLLSLAFVAAPTPAQRSAETHAAFERGVVTLLVTYQTWDEDRPWVKKAPQKRTASAVLVDDRHLLTTAEMVEQAVFLRVEAFGRVWDVQPRIERIDRTVNLVLLSLGDTADLAALVTVAVAGRTPTSGTLQSARWRQQQLELAASRVIRLEVERSWGSHTEHAFLRLRTDMAGGGWAEPVFSGDKLVGITVSQSEDESRAIPAEILSAFLGRDPAPGRVEGFTSLGVNWQINRDVVVSRYLGQTGEPRGILVRQVPWGSSACGVLKPRDIVLELDGESIDADGYYRHPWLGPLRFNHIFAERLRPGQDVPVRVLRAGREQELVLTARTYPAALDIIPAQQDGPPPYVIAGGLVIRELDVPYLRTWGKEWTKDAPDSLVSRYYYEQEGQTREQRRTVLISSVLPSAFNLGYQDLRDVVIEKINGLRIGKIEDVIDALGRPRNGRHVIELTPESTQGQIVLDAATFDTATADIIQAYEVPAAIRPRQEILPAGGGDCAGDY